MKDFHLSSKADLAALLNISERSMNYYIHRLPAESRYREFNLTKRNGGERRISAPILPIKNMQRAIADWLQSRFVPRAHVHGYVYGDKRSILSNAQVHVRQKWLLRVDLSDFFDTIRYGRIVGALVSQPFSVPAEVAHVMARICCYRGVLPQGAPSSPVLSNIVCRRLDRQLAQLAKSNGCYYTRYADDMAFSTSRAKMPRAMAEIGQQASGVIVGRALASAIEANDFVINDKKTVLSGRHQRQRVTGLVVNNPRPTIPRKYLRRLRDQLYAWKTHGPTVVEQMVRRYDTKNRPPSTNNADFREVIRGRVQYVGRVNGWDSPSYCKLATELAGLDSDFKPHGRCVRSATETAHVQLHVFCEGESDYAHLQAALDCLQSRGACSGLSIQFMTDAQISGDEALLKACREAAKAVLSVPHVYIFDNDNPRVIKDVVDGDVPKAWGERVRSMTLQRPAHRPDGNYCIEMLYSDEDLTACVDKDERRLFLRQHFDNNSGDHLHHKSLRCRDNPRASSLVVEKVWCVERRRNVALSKVDFANLVRTKEPPFDKVDFSGFTATFESLKAIAASFLE